MPTEKCFLTDSFLTECTATVLACRPATRKGLPAELAFEILLDRTVCFPEGGGQPSDHAWLGAVPVGYAYEQSGEVWHCCTQPLPVGEQVTCRIDFPRRFELMQQHSGEHLLCAAALKLCGAQNVGFHLSDETLMVDFDKPLDAEQLAAIEAEANRYLLLDAPITARNLTRAEYQAAALRKKAEGLQGEIRLVEMGGLDAATCCGTHCRTTGQVGSIAILRSERYKGGTRVEFACGSRLLRLFHLRNDTVLALGRHYSVTPELVLDAALRADREVNNLKSQLRQKSRQMAALVAESLLSQAEELGGERFLCADISHHAELGKDLCELLSKRGGIYAVLYSTAGDTATYYAAAPKGADVPARALLTALNAALQGRGGGNELTAQGRTGQLHLLPAIRETALSLLHP